MKKQDYFGPDPDAVGHNDKLALDGVLVGLEANIAFKREEDEMAWMNITIGICTIQYQNEYEEDKILIRGRIKFVGLRFVVRRWRRRGVFCLLPSLRFFLLQNIYALKR